ncbi:NgoFVII family restriction endonuclease [Lachnospiraceae bacterium CLA-AA-H215]|uniref:NgoFVII family restriction endonuclease n=1 Tax=Hominifimenecus microfluidus TaxID=2885348 RepID=A0AAE3EDW8_9FIRM|nr:NgoFVII family restriction endonuclease [Hominifimenecus microfluidus]
MRSIRNQSIQTLFHRCNIFFITVHPQIAIGCSPRIHGTVYTFRNDKISVRAYKGSCNLSLIGIGSTSIRKVKCNGFTRSISILFHPR